MSTDNIQLTDDQPSPMDTAALPPDDAATPTLLRPRDSSVASLQLFLEQHRDMYTRGVLREHLVQAGYQASTIDLALARVYGFDLAPPALPLPAQVDGSTIAFGLSLAGTLLLNYLIAPIFAVLLLMRATPELAWLVLLLLPTELAAWLLLRRSRRSIARGIVWGLLGTLPILLGALLIGWSTILVLGI